MDSKKSYPLKSAVEVLVKFPKAKFNETVDLAFRLGVDPKHSDQMVRGTVALPSGTGKDVRVAVKPVVVLGAQPTLLDWLSRGRAPGPTRHGHGLIHNPQKILDVLKIPGATA